MEAVLIGIGIVVGLGLLYWAGLFIFGVTYTVAKEPKILLIPLSIIVGIGVAVGGIALGVHVGGVGGGIIIAVAILGGLALADIIVESV
ncbi:MAG TPA: hypothetical protein VFA20_27280 [Myxococcaceae bacterium]|nr:hypothetical protein [Myxococcaceae bacterium]